MAGFIPPENPTPGQEEEHNGKKLKYVNGRWEIQPQYTGGGSGGGGGLTPEEVDARIDSKLETGDYVTGTEVGQAITNAGFITGTAAGTMMDGKIQSLELGTMSKSNMYVSNNAPDPGTGKNGDMWLQTAAA